MSQSAVAGEVGDGHTAAARPGADDAADDAVGAVEPPPGQATGPDVRQPAIRPMNAPYVAPGPCGVAIRTRLKGLTDHDEQVLRRVGAHLGTLASRDLRVRCRAATAHDADRWAARKRELTGQASARWAGAITRTTHDQWALARRCQLAHLESLRAGIATVERRLALPVGAKGTRRAPGGYRSRKEWFHKARRLRVLKDRRARVQAEWDAGKVHVVRGGKRLDRHRHHLEATGLTEDQWRARWEAGRWFCQADGESGKRYGNETIRVTPDGQVSVRLPAPLAGLANAPHGRYVLAGAMTPLRWRSAGAPSGTRSGDGRHRPVPTRAMGTGIGPPRPDRAHQGVREPAHPSRNAHTMHVTGPGPGERGQPAHPTPFGIRAVPGRGTRCHSWTLIRNGFGVVVTAER